MSESVRFTLVSSVLLPIGIVALLLGLAAWWSLSPGFADFQRRGAGSRWFSFGLEGALLLCVVALLSPRPFPQLGMVFAFYAGLSAGTLATGLLSLFMLAVGWPWPMALIFLLYGPVGALARRVGGPFLLVPLSMAWAPCSIFPDWSSAPIRAYLAALTPHELQLWMVLQIVLGGVLVLLLMGGLEYLARGQERRAAQLLWKVSAILAALRQPLPDAEVLAEALGAEVRAVPTLADVPPGAAGLPLGDQGALAVPLRPGHPLHDPQLVRAIGTLISAELAHRQKAVLEETRYRMLAAQIQPHFLFNALTAVAGLVLSRPEEGHDLIVDLASFLRHSFTHGSDWIRLEEELDCVRAYLAVEKARFREKLRPSVEVDPQALSREVPSMLLQPLVENAVRYGNGLVDVRIRLRDEELEVEVGDDGAGFQEGPPRGHGIGLANVRQRVEALGGSLGISARPGGGTLVGYRLRLRNSRIAEPSGSGCSR